MSFFYIAAIMCFGIWLLEIWGALTEKPLWLFLLWLCCQASLWVITKIYYSEKKETEDK